MDDTHPLAAVIQQAADGTFPPVDGGVDVVEPLHNGAQAVVAFTGHAVVATHRDPAEVRARGADGFGGATSPAFLLWLAGEAGSIGSLDILMHAYGRGTGSSLRATQDLDDHPRVGHARMLRRDVTVLRDDRPGLVTIGTGLAGLTEMSVEVDDAQRSRGVGRSLIASALDHAASGELVIAHVAPGNAQSVRAFVACGFLALGSTTIVIGGKPSP